MKLRQQYYFHKCGHAELLKRLKPGLISPQALGTYFYLRLLAGEANDNGYIDSPSEARLRWTEAVPLVKGFTRLSSKATGAVLAELLTHRLLLQCGSNKIVRIDGWEDEQAAASKETVRKREYRLRKEVAREVVGRGSTESEANIKSAQVLRRPEIRRCLRESGQEQQVISKCLSLIGIEEGGAPAGAPPPASVSELDRRGTCPARTKDPEKRDLSPESRNRSVRENIFRTLSASDSGRSAPASGAGGGAPAGGCGEDVLGDKAQLREMEPLQAAQQLTGEPGEWAFNTLKKRLEAGEQKHGRALAEKLWYSCLEECWSEMRMRETGPQKHRIRNRGQFLGHILQKNGFIAGSRQNRALRHDCVPD
jgi:hypothetical protein